MGCVCREGSRGYRGVHKNRPRKFSLTFYLFIYLFYLSIYFFLSPVRSYVRLCVRKEMVACEDNN